MGSYPHILCYVSHVPPRETSLAAMSEEKGLPFADYVIRGEGIGGRRLKGDAG